MEEIAGLEEEDGHKEIYIEDGIQNQWLLQCLRVDIAKKNANIKFASWYM